MNSEIAKKALEKVGNPNVLVNLISRRVRQLTGAGPGSRPLIADTTGWLETHSLDETLTRLRASERALAASKPTL